MSDRERTLRDHIPAAELLWSFHTVYDAPTPADVIVGLGSYDLRVASKCAELYRQGFAKEIIFSGASGNWTKDLYPGTEAEAFKERAISDGVPAPAICIEPRATNIGENMRFCAELVPNARTVIVVTKPQTQLRAKATAAVQWPNVSVLVTAPAVSFDEQPLPHHDRRAIICEMVGDLFRMEDYAQRGFQASVPIPTEIYTAGKALVTAGFVDHLP